MHPRLEELAACLHDRRATLLRTLDGAPVDLRERSPADGVWSVAGIVEHLSRVERGMAGLIARRSAEARDRGLAETESGSVLGTLDARLVTDRRHRVEAPPRVRPEGLSFAAALAALAASRTELLAVLAAADGVALAQITHPHPALGELNLYQWILFLANHEARHTQQIEETLERLRSLPA